MKYSWSMNALKRQTQAWLFLVVFVISLFGVTFASTLPVYADSDGIWLDKVTIMIGGVRYNDNDPFDNLDYYAGNYKPGNKCEDVLKIENMTGAGDSGTLTKQRDIGTGECGPALDKPIEHITLKDTDKRWVTAYQLDADHIFMPRYRTFADQAYYESGGTKSDGLFERLPNESAECKNDGNATGNSGIDKDKCAVFGRKTNGQIDAVPTGTSVWVNVKSPTKQYYIKCTTLGLTPVSIPCAKRDVGITFANNRVFTQPSAEAAYNVAGAADAVAASNGAIAPTCEANNSGIGMAWLICGIINTLDKAVETSTTAVSNLLSFNGEDFSNDPTLHTVWSLFRAIASFSLLGVALVMIIGQAIGGGE